MKPQTVQIVRQGEATPYWFKFNPLYCFTLTCLNEVVWKQKKTAHENHRERQSIESITKYENITADGLWNGDCFYRWRKLYPCVERFDSHDGASSPFSMKTKPALFILSKRRHHRLESLVELAGAPLCIHIALFARIDGMRGRRGIQWE